MNFKKYLFVNDIIMSPLSNNIKLLMHFPFYGETRKQRSIKFTNAKLLSELQFFEKPITAKIKQWTTKKLLPEQHVYKQSINKDILKSWKTMNCYVSFHFMMILIFQEKKGHLKGMLKPMK